MTSEASMRRAGEVVIAGFGGTTAERFLEALRRGHRGGAILFRRNLPDLATSHALTTAIHRAFEASGQPGTALVAVDEEGGRVARGRPHPTDAAWLGLAQVVGEAPAREGPAPP